MELDRIIRMIGTCAGWGGLLGCGSPHPTPPSVPLQVCFSVQPSSGGIETVFEFDASCTFPNAGERSEILFRWDWNADGIWDTEPVTDPRATRAFATWGEKRIGLEARVPGGESGVAFRSVAVQGENRPPAASFVAWPRSGTPWTEFRFDASGSSDAEDPPESLSVRWDWEGDGAWDTPFTAAKIASHRFSTPCAVGVTLEVRDTGGLVATATESVFVATPLYGTMEGIDPGTFTMGSPPSEPGRSPNETRHRVMLTRGFTISNQEVTQGEWVSVMGWNDSHFRGETLPVDRVTWYDVIEYCNRRSVAEGFLPAYAISGAIRQGSHIVSATVSWDRSASGYRLPTEAEWEYACRAGSTEAFANGTITQLHCAPLDPFLDRVAWYCGNAGGRTRDVGERDANEWGLHDMHGNVWEWCWDRYGPISSEDAIDPDGPETGSERVVRGGAWTHGAQYCRSATRFHNPPGLPVSHVGFRLARLRLEMGRPGGSDSIRVAVIPRQ